MIIYHDNLKSDICNEIIYKFDELNQKQIFSTKKKDDIRIFGFEKVLDNNTANLFFNIDTNSSLKFFKKKPLYQTLMVNKTFVASEKKFNSGSGGGWHRDSYFQKQLKTIFYLTKVNIENGPFTFLEPKLKFFSRFYPMKTRLSSDADKKLDFCSNKISITSDKPGLGFSIISNYIHRGIPLKSGVRYAITVYSFFKKNNHFENLKIKI
mgnify:CR=1 FL=1|tara:strand:+ start:1103 stop:1729 length:627 start_codon:yes stop_codon:yes gene_type:complete